MAPVFISSLFYKIVIILTNFLFLLIQNSSFLHLKAAVEGEFGITDPTPTDMVPLILLEAESSAIVNLTGIEYSTNLLELFLPDNQISDISPLARLTNLSYLLLSGNQISDISDLARLTSLDYLTLNSNPLNREAYCIYLVVNRRQKPWN